MTDTTEQLERLAALHREGLITRAEFDEQKRLTLTNSRRDSSAPTFTTGPGIPDQVGAYLISEHVGDGGMGSVYRGHHRSPEFAASQGGDVAIKVMHAHIARQPSFGERFEREASLGLRLDHPGICKVHALVMDGGVLALVMELVQGEELSELIGTKTGPIPWDRAWPMFEQLLDAMMHMHEEGVLHRDIKPENVLVTEEGRLKLLDLGIAKDSGSNKTMTGVGMGTVAYMAPEQHRDAGSVDQRADVYALGMTLYEMLAGRLPWKNEQDPTAVLHQKLSGDIPPPTDFYPAIPPGVVAALMPALAADREDRTPSVEVLRQSLRSASGVGGQQPLVAAAAPPSPAKAKVPGAPPPAAPKPILSHNTPASAPASSPRLGTFGAGVLAVLALVVVAVLTWPLTRSGDVTSAAKSDPMESASQEPDFPASGSGGTLVVGTGRSFRPMFDLTGASPEGFDIDLGRALAERLGKDGARFVASGSPRQSAEAGDVDLTLAAVSITTERERAHLFSDPYLTTEYVLVGRGRDRSVVGSSTLCSVGPNKLYQSMIRKVGCNAKKYSSQGNAVRSVLNAERELVLIEKSQLSDVNLRSLHERQSLSKDELGVVMQRGNYGLKDAVDRSLDAMRRDGTLTRLRRRHDL